MRALKVEFAARKPLSKWLWVSVTLLLTSFALYEGTEAWRLQRRVFDLQRERADLVEKVNAADRTRLELAARRDTEPLYAGDARQVAKLAAFALDRVFLSLEHAQIEGVRVTHLDVSAAEATARIELEFVNHGALLAYLEAINAGESVPRWVLLQAQSATSPGGSNIGTIASTWADIDR